MVKPWLDVNAAHTWSCSWAKRLAAGIVSGESAQRAGSNVALFVECSQLAPACLSEPWSKVLIGGLYRRLYWSYGILIGGLLAFILGVLTRAHMEVCRQNQRPLLRTQKDHINIRILHKSISGIPLILGLRTSICTCQFVYNSASTSSLKASCQMRPRRHPPSSPRVLVNITISHSG